MKNDKVKLVAKAKLRYASRSMVAGDEFEATARDARILQAMRKAGPPKALEQAAKRTYKRRDLEAEPTKDVQTKPLPYTDASDE